MIRLFTVCLLACLLGLGTSQAEAWITVPGKQPADQPSPKVRSNGTIDPSFLSFHNAFSTIARRGEAEVVFLGDSITAGWKRYGQLFESEFGEYKSVNFGMGGNRTQNVLWRLQQGELKGLKPKVVVLMIGTNNAGPVFNTPEQIVSGIRRIIETIQNRSPATKVLLMGIFPRGAASQDAKNVQVNALLARLHDGNRIHFMDIRSTLVTSNNSIPRDVMPDHLHLSLKGYEIWANSIRGKLAELAQ